MADLTGTNPNVMWELGYAMALKKPALIITQSQAAAPFDVKDLQSLECAAGNRCVRDVEERPDSAVTSPFFNHPGRERP